MGCKVIKSLEIVKSVDFTVLQSVVRPISDDPLEPNGHKEVFYDCYDGELYLGNFTDLVDALDFCRNYGHLKHVPEMAL